nr:ATP-binding cassette domain-containing protein [Corynebacterium lactis]
MSTYTIIALGIAQVSLLLVSLVILIRTPADRIRHFPKAVWAAVIIFLSFVGPILFLSIGFTRHSTVDLRQNSSRSPVDIVKEIYGPPTASAPQQRKQDQHIAEAASVLTVAGLRKEFGSRRVLDGVDFHLRQGEIYGFLGRNGSGKTTTIKAILNLISINAGEITTTAKRIGFLPDVPVYYPWMRADQFLRYCGRLYGLSGSELEQRVSALLDLARLSNQPQRIMDYSRGMRQRLGIAQALINGPELLILDEPTSALDPVGRHDVLAMIEALRGQATVLFSTHLLGDAEKVCDRVGILHRGQIVLEGPLAQLSKTSEHKLSLTVVQSQHLSQMQPLLDNAEPQVLPSELETAIGRSGWKVIAAAPQQRSLEELFIEATSDHQMIKGEKSNELSTL